MGNRIVTVMVPLLLVSAWSAAAVAQTYPIKPVRLVVSAAAGSGLDTVGRILAQRMGEPLGAQMFVDNRPGAGATIGVRMVAKSEPDGYNLLMVAPSFTVNATLLRPPPYDIVRDFAPVGQATTSDYIVVVHPSLPVRTVRDLIELARKRPGQLNYGSGGTGNSTHLSAELFKSLTKVDFTHVPYKGSGPGIIDLMGGQIHLMFANITAVLGHVKAGRLRPIATSGPKRTGATPDLPTVAESGVPDYVVTSWFGVVAPARTPPEIIGRINGALNAAMQQREVLDRLAGEGAEPMSGTPEEFGKLLVTEIKTWARVVKIAGL